jgi:hypothetical protein
MVTVAHGHAAVPFPPKNRSDSRDLPVAVVCR